MARLRGLVAVAGAQLRHDRLRTVLAVLGVAMAVLATLLLVSTGTGVIETGQQKFDQSSRDLWVTGGAVELRPGSAGGFQNTLVNAHSVAKNISARDDVATAVPMAFQTVYVGSSPSELETVVGVGAPGHGPSVTITEGRPFQATDDIHYANGSYDGPMTNEVLIDQRTAELLDVGVGDTIYVGGTLRSASENEFVVRGISPTYSRFVGAPTAVLHLSELQAVTGTTASDRATFISVRLTDSANAETVQRELQQEYPAYTIRTNEEQLEATLQEKVTVIASGLSLVVLAVIAGILLTMNLQLSFVYQQRERLAALQALGMSQSSLVTVVVANTLLIGVLGALVGVALAVPATWAINWVAATVSGFENVVSLSRQILLGGFVAATIVSLLSAIAASVYLRRMEPLTVLRS